MSDREITDKERVDFMLGLEAWSPGLYGVYFRTTTGAGDYFITGEVNRDLIDQAIRITSTPPPTQA